MVQNELSIIGTFHTNHNEDASVIAEIGTNKILIAVMDGCSMGKESHFISTLIVKLLRKIGKQMDYRFFFEKEEKATIVCLEEVLVLLFNELGQLKNQLYLEKEEMLSTLILGILDRKKREAELIIIGDGLICCDGILYGYEQNDKPDYLGYHLTECFDDWYKKQLQTLSLKNINTISIATDGIYFIV